MSSIRFTPDKISKLSEYEPRVGRVEGTFGPSDTWLASDLDRQLTLRIHLDDHEEQNGVSRDR